MKKTFLFLLVALAGAGLTIYSMQIKQEKTKVSDQRKLLYSGSFESLDSFGWSNPPQAVEFEKTNGRWWLKNPYSALADTSEVYNAFQATIARPSEQVFEYTDSLKEFNFFNSPQNVFYSTAQRTHLFKVGLSRGFGDTIYVLDASKTVFVMPFDWKATLERHAEEFLEKQIIPVEQQTWTQIEVNSKRYAFVLQRQDEEWSLVSPVKCKVNADGLKWLNELSNLRSIKVHAAGEKIQPSLLAQLEREKVLEIKLTAAEKIWSVVLRVASPKNQTQDGFAWLRSQSVIHQVFAHSIDQLNLDPRQFCDPVKSK